MSRTIPTSLHATLHAPSRFIPAQLHACQLPLPGALPPWPGFFSHERLLETLRVCPCLREKARSLTSPGWRAVAAPKPGSSSARGRLAETLRVAVPNPES